MSVSTTWCLAVAVLPGPVSAVHTSPAIQLSNFIVCHAAATINHYLNTSPSSDDDDDDGGILSKVFASYMSGTSTLELSRPALLYL